MSVNGSRVAARVEPRMTLADFLREKCGLTGTHLGCEHGACGACTVLVGGDAVRSCLLFAVQADGADVTTVEGIA
ncbi:2Fe-2S iron-sulfur cluster binding domain protein [Mycobacterium ulcerans str. Harvey]|uniref:2Fe-2S iron-sulfur cluster binding domain protein n=1 Tax=Mycobacterium ulcerans str. Harvey TaxID=1299332 RepID=A0ABN0R625_MYCUL|nr:2Fe-2S iron-sulfur cluster binding domain protein [Mycobacterium ulcerans str. Harvey]